MTDARFEDGREAPLRLLAFDAADLDVLSSLVQDAVVTSDDMSFRGGQFGALLSRPRREGRAQEPERVRAVLVVSHVRHVRSSGFAQSQKGLVMSLLRIEALEPGQVKLIFAGDGEMVLDVEAIEVTLRDVARPHAAVSGKMPAHPLDSGPAEF